MFAAARFTLLAAALVALPVSHAPAQGLLSALTASWTQSRIQTKTYDFKEAGKPMEYGLFVPSKYDKTRKTPLIVALHGLYSTPQQILWYPGLTDLAEKHGYIVAAPMGYNKTGWYGAKPLVRARTPQPENLSELSEKDVLNVLEIVRKDFNIDRDRIYLMGHSMGGGGTWHLAIKYPEIWAALAPIAPASSRPATDVEKIRRLPVILIQGAKDRLVRARWVRPWAEEMKKLGMTCEYIEDANGDHISVAFDYLPKIFAFFEAHRRAEEKKQD